MPAQNADNIPWVNPQNRRRTMIRLLLWGVTLVFCMKITLPIAVHAARTIKRVLRDDFNSFLKISIII